MKTLSEVIKEYEGKILKIYPTLKKVTVIKVSLVSVFALQRTCEKYSIFYQFS